MTEQPAGRTLLRQPSDSASTRLFCLPYSGAGASMYNRWPRSLGDLEICPVQLPGRENRLRDRHFATFEEIGGEVAAAISVFADKPFALFGHCSGALIAYETARALDKQGLLASALFVSSQVPPHLCPHDRYLELTEPELRDELAASVRAVGGLDHPAILELGLEVLLRDLAATRRYRLSEPERLRSAIRILHWSEDVEVRREQLLPWTDYSDDVKFVTLPGDRYRFLVLPDQLRSVLIDRPGSGVAR